MSSQNNNLKNIDKNSVVKTYNTSNSNLQTIDEFEKESDEYTKNALLKLQEEMKDKQINTNIDIKSHNYNLRNRKNNKKSKSKIIKELSDTVHVLNSDSEDDDSDIEVNEAFQNMLITNAQNVLHNQNNSKYKRKRDTTFANLTDEDTDVNMTKLMMGQREIELQKNMNLMEVNANLKSELKNKEVQLHYMKLELLTTQNNLSETKDKVTKYKINLEQEIKDQKCIRYEFYKSIFLNIVLLLLILYLSIY